VSKCAGIRNILTDRLATRIADKAVLRLIRQYLQAGIMAGGVAGARLTAAPYADQEKRIATLK